MLQHTENSVCMNICGEPFSNVPVHKAKSVKKGFAGEKEHDWPVQNSLGIATYSGKPLQNIGGC